MVTDGLTSSWRLMINRSHIEWPWKLRDWSRRGTVGRRFLKPWRTSTSGFAPVSTRRSTFHVQNLQEKVTKCLVFSIDSLLCLETETLLLALLNSSRYSIVGGREHIDKVQDSKSQRCALNTGFKLQHHTHKSTSKSTASASLSPLFSTIIYGS